MVVGGRCAARILIFRSGFFVFLRSDFQIDLLSLAETRTLLCQATPVLFPSKKLALLFGAAWQKNVLSLHRAFFCADFEISPEPWPHQPFTS